MSLRNTQRSKASNKQHQQSSKQHGSVIVDDDVIEISSSAAMTTSSSNATVASSTGLSGGGGDTQNSLLSTPTKDGSGGRKSKLRPVSPLRIIRAEEKDELAHLNNRFASYIDYVRHLETTRDELNLKVQAITSSLKEQQADSASERLKREYESELASLRELVDRLAKEKAAHELELEKQRESETSLRSRLSKRESEAKTAQRRIEQLEKETAPLRADRDRLTALELEHAALEKRSSDAQKKLTEEILLRTDLQNRLCTVREQMEFNARIHAEEKSKLLEQCEKTSSAEISISKSGGASSSEVDFDSRLAEELRVIREEAVEEFDQYKLDMERSFTEKMERMRESSSKQTEELLRVKKECATLREQLDKARRDLSTSERDAATLRRSVDELQLEKSEERAEHEMVKAALEDQIENLRADLAAKFNEFSDLMSSKVLLDQEILMYRKMLEGEEHRCRISVEDYQSAFEPDEDATGLPHRKRARWEEFASGVGGGSGGLGGGKDTTTTTTSKYNVEQTCKGAIEFSKQPDVTGTQVTITNNSDNEVSIGNWTLNYKLVHSNAKTLNGGGAGSSEDGATATTGDDDTRQVSYKFRKNAIIRPRKNCTIWSAKNASSVTASMDNGNVNLVLPEGKNFTSPSSISSGADPNSNNKIEINLMNAEGDEEATCEIIKSYALPSKGSFENREDSASIRARKYRSASRRSGGYASKNSSSAASTADKCSIM